MLFPAKRACHSGSLRETGGVESCVLILFPEVFPRLRTARSHGQSPQVQRATGQRSANPYAHARTNSKATNFDVLRYRIAREANHVLDIRHRNDQPASEFRFAPLLLIDSARLSYFSLSHQLDSCRAPDHLDRNGRGRRRICAERYFRFTAGNMHRFRSTIG